MQPRSDIAYSNWVFWEFRNWNMHRVAGAASASRDFASVADLNAEIRGAFARNFKRAWWRGIAYGAVVEVSAITLQADDLKMLVDIRENEKGDVQWVILRASHAQVAVGVHTWVEGYLSPVYREILETLAAEGYKVSSVKREKDGLLKFLTAVADFDTALRTFGAKRTLFPEFREIAAPGPTSPNESTRKG